MILGWLILWALTDHFSYLLFSLNTRDTEWLRWQRWNLRIELAIWTFTGQIWFNISPCRIASLLTAKTNAESPVRSNSSYYYWQWLSSRSFGTVLIILVIAGMRVLFLKGRILRLDPTKIILLNYILRSSYVYYEFFILLTNRHGEGFCHTAKFWFLSEIKAKAEYTCSKENTLGHFLHNLYWTQ